MDSSNIYPFQIYQKKGFHISTFNSRTRCKHAIKLTLQSHYIKLTSRGDLVGIEVQKVPIGDAADTYPRSCSQCSCSSSGSVLGAEDPHAALAQHRRLARIPGAYR